MDIEKHDETAAAPSGPYKPYDKPYEKPAITWRNVIDSRAISIGCAQFVPSDPACGSGSGGS